MDTIKFNAGNTKVVAHRGVSKLERENTCPAFVAAGNRSYFGVETDIHVTKDKKFAVIHDASTKRVTLEKTDINVEETNYDDFSHIVLPDIDDSFDRQDIKIPLLKEYIKICKKYDKKCILELKGNFTKEDAKRMVEEIRALDYLHNMIFISFTMDNCLFVREILPDAEVQWLTKGEEITDELIKNLVDNKLDIDIYYKSLTKERVDLFHKNGMLVNCWTCDEKEDAEELVSWGVDFITSNILEGQK